MNYPTHIFTSYISISGICLSRKDSFVLLFAIYGDILDPYNHTPIEIETSFQRLHNLLSEYPAEYTEDLVEKIAIALSESTEDYPTIDLSDTGFDFTDHIFAFMLIYEEDENGQPYVPKDPSYVLNGYLKRGNLLPEYLDFLLPRTNQKQTEYYNKLLAIRYFFYLDYKNRMDEPDAIGYSNLTDPLLFALAKTQYGIILSEQDYHASNS
jgi:hypothetical protein